MILSIDYKKAEENIFFRFFCGDIPAVIRQLAIRDNQ